VHGIPIERVHFHEVGAVDAIVDVTGAAIALERLGITSVTAAPPALGHGTVETEHGRLPLPAPATLELLRGVPTVPADVAWETVTPTGAAILRTITDSFRPLPALTVERIGHGAGDDRSGPMPNVLRAVLGRTSPARWDRVVGLECNLDDLVPEHFDYLMERLLEAGHATFLVEKCFLVGFWLVLLTVHKNFPLARAGLWGLLVVYSALFAWHVFLQLFRT